MSLKKVELTMADLRMVNTVLKRLTDGKLATSVNVRTIRKKLGIQSADHFIDKIDVKVEEILGEGRRMTWAELSDPTFLLEDLREAMLLKKESLEFLEAKILKISEPIPGLTIDDSAIKWLRVDVCEKVDWAKVKIQSPDGQIREIEVSPSPELLESFADLCDKLSDAVASKPLADG